MSENARGIFQNNYLFIKFLSKTIPCPQNYAIYSVIKLSTDQCGNEYCGEFGTCFISKQQNVFSSCRCSSGKDFSFLI